MNIGQNKKVPEIRFSGFTDAWEQRKLGEIVKIIMGQSPNSTNYTNNPEDHILVQGNADMKNGRVVPRVWTTQITKEAEKNDLILSVRAPVGDIGKTDFNVVIGRGVAAIKGNEFIFQTLGKMKTNGFWNKLSTGSTFESINSNDIKDAIINLPKQDEQRKIGNFFKQLDETITLQERKLNLLKETKKGFLQKMFPKEGKNTPEIRFEGFTDAWEQRKLGELMNVTSVKRIHQSDWTDEGIRFLRARDIVSYAKNEKPKDELFISKDKYDEYSKISGKVVVGDLLVTGVGTIGVPLLIDNDEPFYFKDGNIIWFQNNNAIDGNFLYSSFTNNPIQKYIKNVAGSGTVGTYTIQSGKNTPCKLPGYEEQEKIGNFFKKLDDTITLQERKLELLKEMKKSFLQKMFI